MIRGSLQVHLAEEDERISGCMQPSCITEYRLMQVDNDVKQLKEA